MKISKGFTLIETMVAISILAIAIVAPMSLTAQSLATAYYSRDQITAFNLAQEAIEAVRSIRDGNVLNNAFGTPMNLLQGIPDTTGQKFRVDAHTIPVTTAMCNTDPGGACIALQTDGTLYGYGSSPTWTPTNFTREVTANFVGAGTDEVRVTVTVKWKTGALPARTLTVSENLYRWVNDGSASIN